MRKFRTIFQKIHQTIYEYTNALQEAEQIIQKVEHFQYEFMFEQSNCFLCNKS